MFNINNLKRHKSGFTLIELSIVIIIIGLIIGGIVVNYKMVSLSRVTNARTLTNSSPVNNIEDLVLWVETTSKNSLLKSEVINQVAVSTWNDINPQKSKKDMIQSVSGDRPLFISNGIRKLPSLQFDGTDDNFAIDSNLYDIGSGDNTLFVVMQSDVSTAQTIFVTENGTSAEYGLRYDGTNIEFRNSTVALNVAEVAATITDPHIYTAYRSGVNQTITIDGTSSATASTAIDVSTSTGGSIGELDVGTPIEQFDGLIGEIILYDRALSEFERDQIEEYLSKKWKIALD